MPFCLRIEVIGSDLPLNALLRIYVKESRGAQDFERDKQRPLRKKLRKKLWNLKRSQEPKILKESKTTLKQTKEIVNSSLAIHNNTAWCSEIGSLASKKIRNATKARSRMEANLKECKIHKRNKKPRSRRKATEASNRRKAKKAASSTLRIKQRRQQAGEKRTKQKKNEDSNLRS